MEVDELTELHLALREAGWAPEWDEDCSNWWWKYADSRYIIATGGEADDPFWALYDTTIGEPGTFGQHNEVIGGETFEELRAGLKELTR